MCSASVGAGDGIDAIMGQRSPGLAMVGGAGIEPDPCEARPLPLGLRKTLRQQFQAPLGANKGREKCLTVRYVLENVSENPFPPSLP